MCPVRGSLVCPVRGREPSVLGTGGRSLLHRIQHVHTPSGHTSGAHKQGITAEHIIGGYTLHSPPAGHTLRSHSRESELFFVRGDEHRGSVDGSNLLERKLRLHSPCTTLCTTPMQSQAPHSLACLAHALHQYLAPMPCTNALHHTCVLRHQHHSFCIALYTSPPILPCVWVELCSSL